MRRCDNCEKLITKKTPGVECSTCEKLVHLNTVCSGLSTKQREAIHSSNLQWMCQECEKTVPKLEEAEEIADSPTLQVDVKQLLKDISKEMEKTVRNW